MPSDNTATVNFINVFDTLAPSRVDTKMINNSTMPDVANKTIIRLPPKYGTGVKNQTTFKEIEEEIQVKVDNAYAAEKNKRLRIQKNI